MRLAVHGASKTKAALLATAECVDALLWQHIAAQSESRQVPAQVLQVLSSAIARVQRRDEVQGGAVKVQLLDLVLRDVLNARMAIA